MTLADWAARCTAIRQHSLDLCAPLAVEDHVPQPEEWVSPPKWHLGHTTWFLETLVLRPHLPGYTVFNESYGFVFNSYYESLGPRVQRTRRGDLSRPTVAEVLAYREWVDAALKALVSATRAEEVLHLLELGLQHEQQHQELLLTDIKYILGHNPTKPAYASRGSMAEAALAEHRPTAATGRWLRLEESLHDVGHAGPCFAFDNESPRHRVWLPGAELAMDLVSNAQYQSFMDDGGYDRFEFWHAEGWDWLARQGVRAPLYWIEPQPGDRSWWHYTLQGPCPLPDHGPVTHISYYEASAYAAWAGARLPTEFEWEAAQTQLPWGERWEWTQSAYLPYPGFRAAAGAVGEYNGKFMVGQQVLRGASFATPAGHARHTYRNFFPPSLRWQYTGLRLARG